MQGAHLVLRGHRGVRRTTASAMHARASAACIYTQWWAPPSSDRVPQTQAAPGAHVIMNTRRVPLFSSCCS